MLTKITYAILGILVIVASLSQASNLLGWLAIGATDAPVQQITTVPAPQESSVVAIAQNGEAFIPESITIDTIDLKLPVVSVPLVNGIWAVNDGVANYAQGTSLVQKNDGNVGLYAHDRENGFTRIKELSKGNIITLKGKNSTARYEVAYKSVVGPNDVEVFNPTSTPQLTLITCDGIFSSKRYMVKAKLLEITNYD